MKNSYDHFIDSYASELQSGIEKFNTLKVDEIKEDDLASALNRIDNIYDVGVSDFFERALYSKTWPENELTIRAMADIALKNMNRYGTEMRQILNALEDFLQELSDYLPEEEDDEDDN